MMCSPASPSFVGAVCPDGRHVAVSGPTQTVEVWDARFPCRQLVSTGHHDGLFRRLTGRLLAIAWSPDGTRLASVSSTGSLHVWDARTGIHQRTLLPATVERPTPELPEPQCALHWQAEGLCLVRRHGSSLEQQRWVL